MNNVHIIPAQVSSVNKESIDKPLKVAAYVRVSTLSSEQEDSLENQRKHYKELTEKNPNWTLTKIYADQASGLNTRKRKQFNAMLRDAKKGQFDLLYVKSISRFARNTVTTLTAIRKLNSYGIETRFEKENLSSFESSTNLLLSLMASMAESESISISENVNLGLRYKYLRGEWTVNFKQFLGYDKTPDGNVIINKEQASTVGYIFDEFLSGVSLSDIAKKLEREKRKTATGSTRWTKTAVKRILTNIKYSGDVIQGITTTTDVINKKRELNTGQAPQYFIENAIPSIIDKQTYLIVQGELLRRNKGFLGEKVAGPTIMSVRNPLTKKIVCKKCMANYNRVTIRGKSVQKCYNRLHGNCPAIILKEKCVEEAILLASQKLWDSKPIIKIKPIPKLNREDPESKFIKVAASYMDNVYARKIIKFLEGKRPSAYNENIPLQLIDHVTVDDDLMIVYFYGEQSINVEMD